MSADYRCDWCNEKLDKRYFCSGDYFKIQKKLYNSEVKHPIDISFGVKLGHSDMDICDICMIEVKEEAIKKIQEEIEILKKQYYRFK